MYSLVQRSKSEMVALAGALFRFLQGYRKTAVFAITTQCNCRCIMCDMHRKKPESIILEDASKIIEFLAKNKFLIVYFTGGEPTLHPNIVEMVDQANRLGLATTITTNGTVSKKMLRELKKAGLYLLSVSIDHWDASICEKIRGYKDILTRQVETIKYANEIGLRTYALAFLNSFLIEDGVGKLVDFVDKDLGIPFGFCHPTKANINSYGLGGVLSEEELYHKMEGCANTLLSLKKNGRKIANVYSYIEDITNFYCKREPRVYCKGGEDVVYIDWLGDVYPCFLKERLFNILKGEEPRFLKNVKCKDCLINCFREPSFLPYIYSSPRLVAREIYYSYPSRGIFK